jgi:hypothetical protein
MTCAVSIAINSIRRKELNQQALAMRQVKGQQIAHVEGAIRRFSDDVYYVKSQAGMESIRFTMFRQVGNAHAPMPSTGS